jgi:hypothetical protein
MKLNGNLVLNSDSTGEIQNLYIERVSSLPTFNASQQGRIVFNTSSAIYYYNDGTTWQPFATGGSATILAGYVNNIITSLGAAVNSSGAWQGSVGFSGDPLLAGATSITNALSILSAQVNTDEKLANLTDVALSSLSNNQYLTYNSSTSKWNNTTLVLADVTDVTASAADVNVLHGIAGAGVTTGNVEILAGTTASASDLNSITGYAAQNVTPTEFGYLAGGTPVTSSVQGQLNNKQPLNTGLTNWATIINGSSTGIVVQTAPNTFSERTLNTTASDLTITSPDGVGGNPTFGFAGNTAGLAALSTTGFVVRTGSGTFNTDSLVSGSASRIVVTNGDGVAASPTIDLATVTQGTSGTFQKFTVDGYGRTVDTTPVVIGDLTGLLGTYYLPEAGGTMAGNIAMGGYSITGLANPVNSQDAVTKAYVDAAASSLNVHAAVEAFADTTNTAIASATYTAGTAGQDGGTGVGATLTTPVGVLVVDGYTVALNDRILVDAFTSTSAKYNGIYTVTTLGTGSVAAVLTRASDYNGSVAGDASTGDFAFVRRGTVYGSSGWAESSIGTGYTYNTIYYKDAIIFGTNAVTWTQFSGAGTYTAGVGLSLSGSAFSVNYGAGIAQLPTNDIGINLFNSTAGALILTTDGATRSGPPASATSALALLLKSAGGLTQDINGLYIPTSGVSNAMLANSIITLDVNGGGTSNVALGGTLSVLGNTVQGISTSISGPTSGVTTITVTAANATTASLGVAQFDPASFTVTGGNVVIKPSGVSNTQLANSTIGYSGNTGGGQTVSLGNSFAIDGAGAISTVSAAGTLTINVASATTSVLGVASFNGSQFSVTAGAVSLHTTLGQGGITNVSTAVDSAATNSLLEYNGTAWTAVGAATVAGQTTIGNLGNVNDTGATAGQTLVYSPSAVGTNGSTGAYTNRPFYYLYTGTSATTQVVTHNLGQKYCNVTVVDSTDEVIIPQSITFNSANQLTVTFNSAIACTVIVMGVNLT